MVPDFSLGRKDSSTRLSIHLMSNGSRSIAKHLETVEDIEPRVEAFLEAGGVQRSHQILMIQSIERVMGID